MKQPKKLTLAQKKILTKNELVANNWMLLDEDNISITIINKSSGNRKVLLK